MLQICCKNLQPTMSYEQRVCGVGRRKTSFEIFKSKTLNHCTPQIKRQSQKQRHTFSAFVNSKSQFSPWDPYLETISHSFVCLSGSTRGCKGRLWKRWAYLQRGFAYSQFQTLYGQPQETTHGLVRMEEYVQ